MVVTGNLARGGGWRTTALGAKAHALGQSSTALGCGAVALASHGVALGRGGYVPDQSVLPHVGSVIGASSLFLENTWGHRHSTPYGGIGISHNLIVPSAIVSEFHGADAFDSRYPLWDATVDYPTPTNTVHGSYRTNRE